MKSAFKERQLSDYSATSQRPKRNASTKGLGCSNGLHWMEEKQLKKALYASLNETKKARLLDENASEDGREQTPKTTASTVVAKKAADTDSKRIKVHAQRKFAQGSNPSSPMPTPVKILPQCRESRDAVSQPSTLLPCKRRPKTEDFLTFLCLRGTTALPPALDFMSGTAFPGSSSSSDRSSSPEIDATPQSANAECREKGTSAGAHWGTVSADVRNTAQRAAPRGPKQDRRPFRPESVEEKQGSEQRSSRSATAKKMDRRKIVPEKPKDTLKPGSISRCHSKPNANLTALQEKYKQRRIAHQSGPSRKQSALGHGGGHALRSRTTHGAVHSGSKRVVKAPCVKSKEQLSNAVPNRHPVAGRDEEMAAKNRLVLKRQLSVQLTRLHPRIAAGLRLPIAASSGTGVVTRRRSVGITPHLRKAKMVPPIVDYESESEKDLFPLSPPRSPLVVQPRPRATGTKAHNVSQKPKRKVAISTATKKRPTSVIARKLLNRATTRMRPTSAVRKRTRCTVFRRKTRSLGPVKEYPLVLALPTKRGAGRFGTVAKKKAEVLAAKTAKSKTPLTRSSELPQSVFQSKVSQVSSKASSVQAQQTPKKDAVANQNDRTLKRSTRRVSSECASELRCLRQRSDTTTQCKRETRKAFVDAPEKTRKVVTKRRKVEVSADNTSSQLFSDSDDEPLIKMAGRLSERKALSTTEKDSHSKQDKLGPAQKTEVVTAPLTGMLSRKKAASVKDKNKLPEIDKSRFFKNSLVPERFSEPSPSSLSETIADAAGDPLDTRADFDDLESMSGGVEALDALAGEISQVMSCRLSFGSAQEIQSLMTSEFSGAFDENVTGAMLLGTRDGRSTSFEGGLNLLKRDDTPSKIDAATNTSDESITLLATSTPEELVAVSPEEVSVGTQTAVCDTDGLSSAAVIEAVSRTARRLSFTGSETSTVEAQPGLEAHKPVPASPKSKSSALPVQKSASPSNSTMKPDTRAGSVSSESSTRLGGKQAHISTSVHGARFAARKETSETKAASFFGAAKRSSALDKARPLQRHGSLNPTLGLRASVGRVPKSPAKVAPVPKPGPSKRSKTASDEPRRAKLTPLDSKKFPSENDPACLVAAPTYRPTADEMRDPVSYISKIRPEAEKFGICRIILPPSFQPECKVFDDMRFTAYNQYIHKMLSRWGPNVQHTACIKRCFTKQGITDDQPPLIGGIELDLSYLYHTVQNFGGIQQVMEKKKWHRVADAMHIPKAAQDRVSKVDDAYCKFVLPYDLLSADEKKAIEIEVLADRERQMATDSEPSSTSADEDEEEEFSNECVAKGRSMSLSVFSRVARNTMSMWYKHEPSTEEVEKDYWNLVIDQRRHVCVHAGNIDSSVHGSGFPTNRLVPFAKHPWNLKVLTNNPGTVLRCMGPVSGVTIPTLHLSMLYTTGCWYRDPHCLPWIEYLHTGANKIWYSVPAHSSERFRAAMKEMMPQVCKDSAIWLPSDCAMVPPPQLVEHGCPLSRLVQEKGQFVVIFPGAFTSTIACGYSVSESVYFATQDWLLQASECFEHMKASCEPPTFSFEKLLLGIASELRENLETCRWTLPLLQKMCEKEQRYRTQLVEMGLKTFERLPTEDAADPKKSKRPRLRHDNSNHECDFCRVNCHVSMVVNLQDDCLYCLEHAVHCLQRKNMKSWKLLYAYDMDELRSILRKLEEHIESSDASQMKTDSESSSSKKKVAKKK